MTGQPSNQTIAQRFLNALSSNTLDSTLLAPGAVSWHNTDEVEGDLTTAGSNFAAVRAALPDFHYDELRFSTTNDGLSLARFVIKATLPDGSQLRAPGCLVVTERDGLIVPAGVAFRIANAADAPFEAIVCLPVGARATVDGEVTVPPWAA